MNTRYPLFLAVCLFFLISCREEKTVDFNESVCPTGDLISLQTFLGNPSNATEDENNPNNYLMKMDEYTISYSRDRGIPNWVSWYLSSNWFTGTGSRRDIFRSNPFLPSDWAAPSADSYRGSGFDRGHNCPSADRLCSDNFNAATFYMTNMIPQSPENNRKIWRDWECYLRDLANEGNELYIVMGNYGQGGKGSKGSKSVIKDDEVTIVVPKSVWKVAIVIPENEGNDIQAINAQSTVIAIDVPNDEDICSAAKWDDAQFITTVDDIENKMGAGFDLFSKLPENVQSALETKKHQIPANYTPCN